MCGIAGIVNLNNPAGVSEASVREMTSRLVHRGPDGEGYRFERFAGLGHRRLGVIDLEGGAQPMSNEDGSIWIVYNGEIYNFAELARELKNLGHKFTTRCDTEVIIHAYEQWGTACLDRMNGMFAFAIWDSAKRGLFLARDRLGVKPLFYVAGEGRVAFASELRALLPALPAVPDVDPFGLTSYFLVQYVPAPRTILRGVSKLPPGHAAILDDKGFKTWRWWRAPEDDGTEPLEGADAKLREMLEDSVRMRLIADVPLGAFLSGGIDSTTIVALMSLYANEPVRTFQVAFEDPPGYDETPFAEIASRRYGTHHNRLVMYPADLEYLLPRIARGLGEPVADPALIPTYMVSKLAREQVTVALTGEGADELFGGYQRYGLERFARPWGFVPAPLKRLARGIFSWAPKTERIVKGIDAISAPPGAARHLAWLNVLPPDELARLLPGIDVRHHKAELVDIFSAWFSPERDGDLNPLGKTLRCDIGTWLPDDLLAKVDYMSMAHGLEARVPYLDYRLVEWALKLPDSARIRGRERKAVLKDAAAPLVPEAIRNRGKWGFTLPLDDWFRGPLKGLLNDSLNKASNFPLLERSVIKKWVEDHNSGSNNHSARLFSLLLITLWLENLS